MIPKWKLEGADALDDALHELEGTAAKSVVRAALLKALEPVATLARSKVPVRRGDLQQSIGVGTRLTKRQRRLRVPLAPVEAYVGPGVMNKGGARGVAHAHLVEFGTAHSAPRPYMRPAWQAKLQGTFKLLAEAMSASLAKAAARAAARAKNGR